MPDVDNPEEFRCISLCTGYAGLELGIRRAVPTLRTVCYVEVEAFACANLVAKIEAGELDAAPIWTDIKTFDGRPFRKRVHIITAGYPCQPFSVAGKRQGTADPRHLWPHIERIIETIQPVWFFGENVSGHLTIGFPTVYRSLRNLGYTVEAGLFTAAECGAPHKRQRLFILGHSQSNGYVATKKSRSIKQAVPNNTQGQNTTSKSSRTNTTRELADTESKGFEASKQSRNETTRPRFADQNSNGMWPARPGQPQYEWEEPRVVDNTQHRRHEQQKGQIQTGRDGVEHPGEDVANTEQRCRRGQNGGSQRLQRTTETAGPDEGQTQSRLGRVANGTFGRVDRLRLLGNGVVPQQAEKAFRTLMALFEKKGL